MSLVLKSDIYIISKNLLINCELYIVHCAVNKVFTIINFISKINMYELSNILVLICQFIDKPIIS